MKEVELRPAFAWTCDKCGRDHMAEVIVDDRENLDDAQQAVLDHIELPAEAVDFLRVPSQVRCPDCDIWYRSNPLGVRPVDDDEELDEDG